LRRRVLDDRIHCCGVGNVVDERADDSRAELQGRRASPNQVSSRRIGDGPQSVDDAGVDKPATIAYRPMKNTSVDHSTFGSTWATSIFVTSSMAPAPRSATIATRQVRPAADCGARVSSRDVRC
jgi:hypothetical protein